MIREEDSRKADKKSTQNKNNKYTNYAIVAFQSLAKSLKVKLVKAPKLLAQGEECTIIFSHNNENDNSRFLKTREFLSILINFPSSRAS